MCTASSAKRTTADSASAVEYTATDLIPSSRQARATRRAISPRLAISTFSNTAPSEAPAVGLRLDGLEVHQHLLELHPLAVLGGARPTSGGGAEAAAATGAPRSISILYSPAATANRCTVLPSKRRTRSRASAHTDSIISRSGLDDLSLSLIAPL